MLAVIPCSNRYEGDLRVKAVVQTAATRRILILSRYLYYQSRDLRCEKEDLRSGVCGWITFIVVVVD